MLFEKVKLEDDEKVIRIVHRHWFFILMSVFGVICTAFVPLILWLVTGYFINQSESVTFDLTAYLAEFGFFFSIWLLFHWMMVAYTIIDHHLDIWIITDRRIISVDQHGLFKRGIGSFRLEKLQDVNIEINGIVATFLRYGTVEAQTASGSEEEFRSTHLPNPRELKSIILEAADERMKQQMPSTTPTS